MSNTKKSKEINESSPGPFNKFGTGLWLLNVGFYSYTKFKDCMIFIFEKFLVFCGIIDINDYGILYSKFKIHGPSLKSFNLVFYVFILFNLVYW